MRSVPKYDASCTPAVDDKIRPGELLQCFVLSANSLAAECFPSCHPARLGTNWSPAFAASRDWEGLETRERGEPREGRGQGGEGMGEKEIEGMEEKGRGGGRKGGRGQGGGEGGRKCHWPGEET